MKSAQCQQRDHAADVQAVRSRIESAIECDRLLADSPGQGCRIAWLPKERDGRREAGWSDLLALRNPRRPGPRRQGRIVEQDADRYRVVVGEPARLRGLQGALFHAWDVAASEDEGRDE